MPRYVAFLRGINLGNRRLKMETLRDLFSALKFADVTTFIASGNVIFSTAQKNAAKLETAIQDHLQRSLGYQVDTFVRTPEELAEIISVRPFPDKELDAEGHTLHVCFLRSTLSQAETKSLLTFQTPMDLFHTRGRELYWLCRGKTTYSQVKWPTMAKAVAATTTARNIKMLRRLMEMLEV